MSANKKKNPSKNQQIKALTEENQKLKQEIENLKEEIDSIKKDKILHKKGDAVSVSFENQALNAKLYSKKSYTTYLAGLIANTSFFRLYKRLLYIVRKYTFISTTLKIIAYILTFVQSGALFVLAASVSIISLPFTFIIGYSALAAALFGRRRLNKKLSKFFDGKNIFVMFPQRGNELNSDSFFSGNAKEFAKGENNAVIIVSPYFFSSRSISGKKKVFISAREEDENILTVKRHYYFTLKRKLLKTDMKKITFMY